MKQSEDRISALNNLIKLNLLVILEFVSMNNTPCRMSIGGIKYLRADAMPKNLNLNEVKRLLI